MNNKVFLSMDKVIGVEPAKIDVPEMMEKDFWLHHDHKEEDKYELFRQCSMVPDVLRKIKNNESLSSEEKYAYNLYYGNEKPELYQETDGKIRVKNGRHRMAALIITNTSIPLEVSIGRDFESIKDKQIQQPKAQRPEPPKETKKLSLLDKLLGKKEEPVINYNRSYSNTFRIVENVVKNEKYSVEYISTDNEYTEEKLRKYLQEEPSVASNLFGDVGAVFKVKEEITDETIDDFLEKINVDKNTVKISKIKNIEDDFEER